MIIFIKIYVKSILILLLLSRFRYASLTNASELEIEEKYNRECSKFQFKCNNGQCIHRSFLCDGISDCVDNSDEAQRHCSNTSCGTEYFQCNYGACIKKEYQYDGLKQCNDGSDELMETFNTTSSRLRRRRRAVNSCAIPSPSADKTIKYKCNGQLSSSCLKNGFAQNSAVAVIECNPGYAATADTTIAPVCSNNKWTPAIWQCSRKCDQLTPVNVNLQCYQRGVQINCDAASLQAGTRIRPACKDFHIYNSSTSDHGEIVCKEDGKWDKPALFQCVPECGRSYSDITPLISYAKVEKFGDSPWHVAIYDRRKELICGGTIIHLQLVLSAAHCFSSTGPDNVNAADFEVVVSKFSRNYTIQDNRNQKVFKIKQVHFSDKGYAGLNGRFAADIVILVLDQKITLSPTVLPACLDYTKLRSGVSPADGTFGKVSGWGRNQKDALSNVLMTANLPFISRKTCLNIVPADIKPFLGFDKFCAGSERGPGVLQGDSGGGLLFRENDLYYLRGIVSSKESTSTPIAMFTDLADHVAWIHEVAREMDGDFSNKNLFSNSKKTNLGDVLSLENTQNTRTSATVANSSEFSLSDAIGLDCKKYAKYATDCIHVVTPERGATRALPKEYPHNALIGNGDLFEEVEWEYSGTLISEKFVLSVAHYVKTPAGESKWVLLGDLDTASQSDDAQPRVYSIVQRFVHPNYNGSSYHDIALFQLNASVIMNAYIRPACLYTSAYTPVNEDGKVTAWGISEAGERRSDQLLRTTVTILEDHVCQSTYKSSKKFDSNTMVCIGNSSTRENLCVGISGSPLQFSIKDHPCMTMIFGIASIGDPFCTGPDIYIRVSYYLDWIQSIVWP